MKHTEQVKWDPAKPHSRNATQPVDHLMPSGDIELTHGPRILGKCNHIQHQVRNIKMDRLTESVSILN